MRICFASNNKNKIKELNEMLSGVHEIYGLSDLGIVEDIPETGKTLEENSLLKAKYVFDRYRVAVIADDSGLMVKSLGGEPGVYSARYAGNTKNDEANMDLLLQRLSSFEDRSAEFKTVITFIDETGDEFQFSGSIPGKIIFDKRGTNGFGYDPIFQPTGYDLTFAELSSEIKNKISHRAKAVQKLIEYLHHVNE